MTRARTNRRARAVLACALCAGLPGALTAPAPPARAAEARAALSLQTYLAQVAANNLDLAAQRANVPIAEAQIAVAKMFPDATITGGVSQVDVSGQDAPFMSTLGVNVPLELGGKRGARIAVAARQTAVTSQEVEDFYRTLRADAARAFVDGLYTRLVVERKRRTLESLERLVQVNRQRFQAGDIGEVAVIQSRVEAQRYHGEVLAAEAEVHAADLAVLQMLGSATPAQRAAIEPLPLRGDLRIPARTFDADKLVEQARSQRPDVRARQLAQDVAQARVGLAHANRWVDILATVSWQRSLFSDPFASPQYDALAATLTVPLPLSRIYRGELDAALHTEVQARAQTQSILLRAEVEVRTSLARYQAAASQVALYTQGVLADADRVLAAILYSYQRGGATLLEVLTAQRTVDDVSLAYYGALADHARQLIAVELASGGWDVTL